jgi:hypothetical protein
LAQDEMPPLKGRKKVFNMTATGIVLTIIAWAALQIPLGMLVGHSIRRTRVAAACTIPKPRPRPFVGHTSALRG